MRPLDVPGDRLTLTEGSVGTISDDVSTVAWG